LKNRPSVDAAGEKLRPLHVRPLEVLAELFGETGHVERSAGAVGEHQAYLRVSAALPPRLQGTHDAGIERPSAGAVGLVLVEANRAHVEVQVLPSETHGFTPAAPLARQEPVENTVF
jgi:hypothetical protein